MFLRSCYVSASKFPKNIKEMILLNHPLYNIYFWWENIWYCRNLLTSSNFFIFSKYW